MTTATGRVEHLTRSGGERIATLTWRDNGDGRTEWCRLDNATMVRDVADPARLTVRVQSPDTGRITPYRTFTDTTTAFWALGLSTHRCNGVNAWNALTDRGTAGRD